MPKQQPSLDRELNDVLSRAGGLYPRLVARRVELAAELATVEAALAQLSSLGGKLGSVTKTSAAKATPSRIGTRKARTVSKSLTASKLHEPVLAVLATFKKPVGSADIASALSAKGLSVRTYPLQVALKRLRDEGRIRATGKARRFSYELAAKSR